MGTSSSGGQRDKLHVLDLKKEVVKKPNERFWTSIKIPNLPQAIGFIKFTDIAWCIAMTIGFYWWEVISLT